MRGGLNQTVLFEKYEVKLMIVSLSSKWKCQQKSLKPPRTDLLMISNSKLWLLLNDLLLRISGIWPSLFPKTSPPPTATHPKKMANQKKYNRHTHKASIKYIISHETLPDVFTHISPTLRPQNPNKKWRVLHPQKYGYILKPLKLDGFMWLPIGNDSIFWRWVRPTPNGKTLFLTIVAGGIGTGTLITCGWRKHLEKLGMPSWG